MDNPLIPTVKYATLITEGDGVKTAWEFNFAGGYLSPAHIKAFTEDTTTGELVIRTLALIGPNTAQIVPAVADGLRLVIYRDTPKDAPLVDYSTGSIINESNLDRSNLQSVFINAELADRVVSDYDFSNSLLYAVQTATAAAATANGIDAKATEALAKSLEANAMSQEAFASSARFDTIADMLAVTPSRRTFADCLEYMAGSGGGGGGPFEYRPTSTAAPDDILVFRPASDPAMGRWHRTNIVELNAKMAGVWGQGGRNDTTRTQAYLNFCKNTQRRAKFTPGTYRLEHVEVRGAMFTFDIDADGCYFEAMASTTQDALFSFYNTVDINFTGVSRWNGADNPNYRCAIAFHAIPAEAGAGSQAVTRVKLYNMTFRNWGIGASVGDRNVDYQCSELNLIGCEWFAVPCPIYVGGANAGFQTSACDVTSERNVAFPSVPECAVWSQGGFFKIVGGSAVTNPTAQALVVMEPCISALYGGQLYGTGNIIGAHTEANSPLLAIRYDAGMVNRVSTQASMTFIGNTGYVGGDGAQDAMYANDVTYAGTITALGNNWYSTPGRTGYNASSNSPLISWCFDSTSFGAGFEHWLGGIGYGRAVHGVVPVCRVTGANQSFPNNAETTLKLQVIHTDGGLIFYAGTYSTGTGVFKVPPGGFTEVVVNLNLSLGGVGITAADCWLSVDGVPAVFGLYAGGALQLSGQVFNLTHGQELTVTVKPYGAAGFISSDAVNQLTISGSTM